MIDFEKYSNSDLIHLYSKIISNLKARGVIRTKNIIGDLGEYLAIEHYNNTPGLPNLLASPPGTQNIDAISRQGERYSIKSTSGKLTSVFYGLNDPEVTEIEKQKFEYVIVVLFKDNFELDKIIELSWEIFLNVKKWHKTMRGWNISINNKLLEVGKIRFDTEAT